MLTIAKISTAKANQAPQPNNAHCYGAVQKASFLQEVIENLQDGILILTKTGEVIHANTSAYHILAQLSQGSSNLDVVPPDIWSLCTLLESRSLFPDQSTILSNEIVLDRAIIFRVRVRWLNLENQHSCFLVTIENKYESLKNLVVNEVKKYELTPRETEIWCLYRARLSYKDIAAKLYITVNTVKKHMKNIHAKRQAFLEVNS